MKSIHDLIDEARALGLDTVGMNANEIQDAILERMSADAALRLECYHRGLNATGTYGEACHRLAQAIGIRTVGVTETGIFRAIIAKRDAVAALRRQCDQRGLSVNGTEDELRSRLAASDRWPTKMARLAATGVRTMLDACIEEVVGERVPDEASADGGDQSRAPTPPPSDPPHGGSTRQEVAEEAPPPRVPPRLFASPAILHATVSRPCLPEVMPRQRIPQTRPPRATPLSAPDDHWGLRFSAYAEERVRNFLHSHRTNHLHPFHSFHGNSTALDTALSAAHAAYSQFATEGDAVFCTRCCPARFALVAFVESDRHDFARRLGHLLGTPFVTINGAEVVNPFHFIRICHDGWNANSTVREWDMTTWPHTNPAPSRFKVTLPPMSVFLDGLPSESDVRGALFEALAGVGVIRVVVGDRLFEWDASRVCVMVGVENYYAMPAPFRSAFSRLQVGRPFLVWGRETHDAIFGNDWAQRLKRASRIIATYDELRWLIDAADSTTGHFRDAGQFFALEGLLGILYEVGEHPDTSTNPVVCRGWELHSSLLQDETYLKTLWDEIERRTKR